MEKQTDHTEVNPIYKKDDICKLLDRYGVEYEIHNDPSDGDYNYLQEGSLCITVINTTSEYPLYIDLEDMGEFTLTYYRWHCHYTPEECSYDEMITDLKNILNNNICLMIIYSKARWLSSSLSQTDAGRDHDYKTDLKRLPAEFRKEIKKTKGKMELVYWDTSKNITIDL